MEARIQNLIADKLSRDGESSGRRGDEFVQEEFAEGCFGPGFIGVVRVA